MHKAIFRTTLIASLITTPAVFAADSVTPAAGYYAEEVSYDKVREDGARVIAFMDQFPEKTMASRQWPNTFLEAKCNEALPSIEQIGLNNEQRNQALEKVKGCYTIMLEGLTIEKSLRESSNDSGREDDNIVLLNAFIAAIYQRANLPVVSVETAESQQTQSRPAGSPLAAEQGSGAASEESEDREAEVSAETRTSLFEDFEQEKLEERMKRIVSNDDHFATFHVGSTLMPEYDDDGVNQGFQETNAFLHFQWDNRNELHLGDDGNAGFSVKNTLGKVPLIKYLDLKGRTLANFNFGIEVDFFSENFVNCAKLDPPAGDMPGDDSPGDMADPGTDDGMDGGEMPDPCTPNNVDLANVEFNDVSNTVKANVYAWLGIYQSESRASEWSIGVRKGMESREKLNDNGDSVNSITNYGIRYVYNDWNDTSDKNGIYDEDYENGMPRIYFEYSKGEYEDYNGLGPDSDREIYMASYRIKRDLPIYTSLIVNKGTGPDEVALTLSYGMKLESIVGMFGGEQE